MSYFPLIDCSLLLAGTPLSFRFESTLDQLVTKSRIWESPLSIRWENLLISSAHGSRRHTIGPLQCRWSNTLTNTMSAASNSNESYCTFTLASDVTAGGLPSEEEIAKQLESNDPKVCMSWIFFIFVWIGIFYFSIGSCHILKYSNDTCFIWFSYIVILWWLASFVEIQYREKRLQSSGTNYVKFISHSPVE